jgi:hypothetical protein
MAVTLTGTGGLFTRLGKLFGLAKTIRQHQQAIAPTAATSTSGVRTIYSVYASTTGTLPMATDLVRAISDEDVVADASVTTLAGIKSAAERTLVEMVDADTRLPEKTVPEAMRELAFQMNRDGEKVALTAVTVGSSSYNAANTGNAVVIVSVEAPKIIKDNVVFSSKVAAQPYVRAETLTFSCSQDTKVAGVSSGSERWMVTGDRSFPNLDRRWRAGSGTAMMLTATSGDQDGGGAPGMNILTNGDFEVFESDVPINWTLATGTANTHVQKSTTAQRGTGALKIIGDGSNLTRLTQRLNFGTGTYGKLKGDTLYLVSCWVRADGGAAPLAGVLRISFRDGTNTVLTGMTFNVDLTAITLSYVRYGLAVVSPVNIPDEAYMVVELTTAITSTQAVLVDEVTVCEMQRLAPGGPGVAIVAGSTDSRRGDLATVAISNNAVGEMNLELDRFFGLYETGIFLPSGQGTNVTVADSLIS